MTNFRIQSTPNPLARKYIVNRDLKAEGKVSYRSAEECDHVPMARALISQPAIAQIHFFDNVLTVTQDGLTEWGDVDRLVQGMVNEHIDSHDPSFRDFMNESAEEKRGKMSPELQQIDEILEHTIRPALQADGGDLELVEYDGEVLSVRYMGACGDCPSSTMGTLHAIRSVLQREYRPDIDVVVV